MTDRAESKNRNRESLMKAMAESHQKSPNKELQIKHVYQDGNSVIVHSRVNRATPNSTDIAVVHIMRFEKNKIIEMWDLGQLVEVNSPNENGLF